MMESPSTYGVPLTDEALETAKKSDAVLLSTMVEMSAAPLFDVAELKIGGRTSCDP